jgi:phosphoribosylanthranilate isomerase
MLSARLIRIAGPFLREESCGAVIVQIYEVSTPDDAQSISAIGIDHIGVLLGAGEFPRELSLETARNVADGILPVSKFSALFLTANLTLITASSQPSRPR